MPNAARTLDMHICPKTVSGPVPVPHMGGPIAKPDGRTVYIGKMPAAVEGDKCPCLGDPAAAANPDKIKKGSSTVNIQGSAAARMGDPTDHGGAVSVGCPTVFVGG